MGMHRSCRRASQSTSVEGRRLQNWAVLNMAPMLVKELGVHLWAALVQMVRGHSGLGGASRNFFIFRSNNAFSQVNHGMEASALGLVLRALLVTQWGSSTVSLLLTTRGLSVFAFVGGLSIYFSCKLVFCEDLN
jgi:hypothetical protein